LRLSLSHNLKIIIYTLQKNKMSFLPNVAIAPWRTIQNEIINLDMTQREFAERLGISEKHLSQLINGKVWLTFEIAQKLEQITNIPASFWNKLELKYQEDKARLENENSLLNQKNLLSRFSCYSELVKLKLVENTRDTLTRIKNLCDFLNVVSLDIITEKQERTFMVEKLAFRKSSINKLSPENLACRIKAWEKLVDFTDKEYNKEKILGIIPKLKELTNNQETLELENIKNILNGVGINFIVLDHFKEVPVNWISRMYKNKPLIQLSRRQKWLDIFWFTLFHELAHVYNWDLKKETVFVDWDDNIKNDMENMADDCAQKWLISKENYCSLVSKHLINVNDLKELAGKEWIWINVVAGRVAHELKTRQPNIWKLTSTLRPTIKK